MNEISKPNDILVSTILNPNASVRDLIANGINETNTGIYDKDVYKNSDFIKNAFTTKDGVFDDDTFNKVYDLAMEQYNQLAAVQTYNDLSAFNEYNPNDLYAPVNSKKYNPTYNIEKVRNPFRTSKGVKSLFEEGESSKSNRELAQMHKVWDSENQKWLDYTAEDQGFLGLKYLGRPSLVYATWDEDGVHYDPLLGRDVQHRKGEWKTDENGEFYTETAGNKELYGKEFVAYSDILSKEDSWINKIDFFDSDDKEKSWQGTMFKNLAAIAPFMVPGLREIWGGTTAAIALASVMPTFGKMVEGIALGDSNTAFTKGMNTLENYFNKFNPSYSDEAMTGNFNFEKMADTVSDIFAQLYQMRAAASLSKLFGNAAKKAQKESFVNFADKFGAEWMSMARKNPKLFKEPEKEFVKLWEELVDQTPEMKAILKKQSKISQSLSLGYMALTSSADVYADALDGGYDRRMAGFAGIIAAAGQYGIMMNNPMGKWFLDATTGYSEDVSRNLMKKALRPYYSQIQEGIDKIAQATTKEAKLNGFAKVINSVWTGSKKGLTTLRDILRDGGEEFWKRSIIEGVEEVTEEAVMDTTKAMFDFMSWLGVGKNKGATFDTLENTFSQAGLERYLMNLVGGLMGGALFELQGKVIQPAIDAAITGQARPEVTTSLIKEIRNGNTHELLRVADMMGRSDKSAVQMPGGETTTRGSEVAKELKNYIKFVEGIVVDNGLDLSDEQVLRKAVRDRMLEPLLQDSGVTDVLIQDFNKATAELADIQAKLNLAEATANEDGEKKTDNTKQLQSDLKEKKKELEAFLNGENTEYYLKLALQYLHPVIREAVFGMDKYAYTKAKYNQNYSNLDEKAAGLSKEKIDREYENWKKSEDNFDKFKTVGVQAYDLLQQNFSKVIFDYANANYQDVRKNVLDNLFRKSNFLLGAYSGDAHWRKQLGNLSESLHRAGLPGANIEDMLQLGDVVKQDIVSQLSNVNSKYLEKILPEIVKQQKEFIKNLPLELQPTELIDINGLKETFEQTLLEELSKYPLEALNGQIINNAMLIANNQLSTALSNSIFNQLSEEDKLDPVKLKESVDKELVKLDYSPDPNFVLNPADPQLSAAAYINAITAPKLESESSIDFITPVLTNYINTTDILDGEVVNQIKNKLTSRVTTLWKKIDELKTIKYPRLEEYDEDTDETVSADIPTGSVSEGEFRTIFYDGVSNNIPVDQIVQQWIETQTQKLTPEEIALLQEFDYIQNFTNDVIVALNEDPLVQIYNTALGKGIIQNPFYNFLREFGMQVFDGDDMNLFQLLEQESTYLSKLPSALDYIRQGITKESIDNFLGKLDLLEAVVVGTEGSELNPDNLISYNSQMQRFAQQNQTEAGANAYQTVKTEDIATIHQDIDLLRNKLQFLKNLIESNTQSKEQENAKTQENIENNLVEQLDYLKDKLTAKGISFYPDQSELNALSGNSEKLQLIKHTLYQKMNQLLKDGSNVDEVVSELFDNIDLNASEIFNKSLKSNGLSSTVETISEYDLFVWLTSALAHDSNEFYYKYNQLLKDPNYKKVPFYIQEYAAELAYSFVMDSTGVHNAAVNYLYSKNSGDGYQQASNIFFVDGIAGSGKTSTVLSLVAKLANKSAILSAPQKSQLNNLKASLSSLWEGANDSKTFNKQELLQEFITDEGIQAFQEAENSKDNDVLHQHKVENFDFETATIDPKYLKEVKNPPEIIFIDEATHFNLIELAALEAIAEKYNIKILTSGDLLQKGNNIQGTHNIDSIFAFKSPTMLISVRSSKTTKKDNIDVMQSKLKQCLDIFRERGYSPNLPDIKRVLQQVKLELKYYQTDSEFSGDKIVDEISVEDLKTIKKAAQGKTIAVIANLDGDNNIKDASLVAKLKDAGITDYEVYTFDQAHEKAVQGSEADFVIINDAEIPNDLDNYQNLVNLYTYLSRSLEGTLAKLPRYKNPLNIQTLLLHNNGDYSLPGLEKQASLKDAKSKQIEANLKDYKPEEPESPKTPTPEPTAETVEDNTEKNIILQTEGEGEEHKRENKGKIKQNIAEADTYKPNSLYGYGFYDHIGIKRNADGTVIMSDDKSHLNLNGLLPSNREVSKNFISGFIRLKRLITLSPDANSEAWKKGLDDDLILDFLDQVNPSISSETDRDIRREEILEWAIDNLRISSNIYVFGKKFDLSTDRAYNLPTENTNSYPANLLMYGRRLFSLDGTINQYISNGNFPELSTLTKNHVEFKAYTDLVNRVNNDLKSNKFVVYKLDSNYNYEIPVGISLYNDPETWISLSKLKYGQNLIFNEDQVYLINGEKATVNGINSFAFLHYIASHEVSQKSYADRISDLEKAFVKDGKLTVTGKYFTSVSFTQNADPKYKRVIILEPNGFSYRDALEYQRETYKKRKSASNSKSKRSALEEKAIAMSQSSQMHLLQAMFEQLNAIDPNTHLAIGDGIKPYVDYVVEVLLSHSEDANTPIITTVENMIKEYKQAGKQFDLAFLSDLLKQTRYFGIFFIDNFLGTHNNNVVIRKLPDESKTRSTIDFDFNLDDISYKEFGVGFNKITEDFGDGQTVNFYAIKLNPSDLNEIGLLNHVVQMPKVNFSEDALRSIQPVKEDLETSEIDRTNEKLIPKTTSKPVKTTAKFSELRKLFKANKVITRKVPSKSASRGFYKIETASEEKIKSIKQFKIKNELRNKNGGTNGFDLQVGDTIQLFGDTTHTYRIGFINFDNFTLKFDQKDGKEIDTRNGDESIAKWGDVSNIVSRTIFVVSKRNKKLINSLIDNDFYQSKTWKKLAQSDTKNNADKIISANDLTPLQLEQAKILDKSEQVLLVPVLDSDSSALDVLNQDADLQEGNLPINGRVVIYSGKDYDELYEQIQNLQDTENLNGIAIISLYKGSTEKLATPEKRKELFKGITDGYIKAYIASSESPHFNEQPKKQEAKAKTKKEVSVKEVAERMIKESGTKDELLDKLLSLSKEDQSKLGNHFYNLTPVLPKWSYLKKILSKEQLDELLGSEIPITFEVGDTFLSLHEKDDGYNRCTITKIDGNQITVNMESNGKTYEKTFDYDELNWEFGVKYIWGESESPETTSTVEEKTPIQVNTTVNWIPKVNQKYADKWIQKFNTWVDLDNLSELQKADLPLYQELFNWIMGLNEETNPDELQIEDLVDAQEWLSEIGYIKQHRAEVDSIADLYTDEFERKYADENSDCL